jgi:cobalt-precorrin 5A hydrolase
MRLAIYALTVNGAKLGRRLQQALAFADLFVSDAAQSDDCTAQHLTLPLSTFVGQKFISYDGHIFICATGIVTRVISSLIKDKKEDPAVVCLDEQGKFAISLLSGHRGGANQLSERVAYLVKATPVITTASEVSETVSADMLGAPFGWTLDPVCEPAITEVATAIVNHLPVLIAQEAGEKSWWQYEKRMPAHLLCHDNLYEVNSRDYRGAILISDKRAPQIKGWENKLVLWRPRSLYLGLGCDRNTPLTTLKAGLQAFSEELNLSLASVAAIASIDLKADEAGLLALAEEMQWPFISYSPEQLDGLQGVENPSDYVKKVTGSNSVAEAAALKAANSNKLLVSKWRFKQDGFNMTIACCRKTFSESLVRQKRKNWFAENMHGSDPGDGQKINAYGNEVVAGYQCKPKHVALNRPMLHYRHHIFICEGLRCARAGSKNLAHHLRGMLKEMGLAAGEKRIKVSRSMCMGACRNRAMLVIYERPQPGTIAVNNGLWLRKVEAFSENQWRALFTALAEQRPIREVLEQEYFAPIENSHKESDCG